ncbi:kinase-like domain-containing protein [Mycena capillaripes]|nr:kinase-like domain-containing protein [Mycena capillaripes]
MRRFLGLNTPRVASESTRFLRSTGGEAVYQSSGPTTPTPSEPSPSTSSPATPSPATSSPATSSRYALSPATSSPDTSPSLSSPTTSLCNPRDAMPPTLTHLDQSGNHSPIHQILDIQPHTSYEGGLSPPSYEAAIGAYSGSRERNSASLSNTSAGGLALGQLQPGTGGANSRRADVDSPPLLVSPLQSPTIRVTAPSVRTEVDSILEHASPMLSPDSSMMPSSIRPTSIRRPRLSRSDNTLSTSSVQRPAGARSPYTPPHIQVEGLYTHTFFHLKGIASNANNSTALADLESLRASTSNLADVKYLVHALRHLDTLSQISMELGISDNPSFRAVLEGDQSVVTELLLRVLYSPSDEQAVLALKEDAAQAVLDLIQHTLDHALIRTREANGKARRLLGKLCEKCDKFPTSLSISGVTERGEHVSVHGGYGDIFKAMYRGKPVALKHMRIFQDTNQRDIRRRFYREALIWQRLSHSYTNIVPLIGIDTESFPPSLCLVSPWMKNGTVNKYLSRMGETNRQRIANHLIQEIAQGLAVIHEERVVHGDLRGDNILVDDLGKACLTDFGLTVLSDASTSQTRNGSGTTRWMAPEILQNLPRTPASDIYAFACVCFELFTGYPPFFELRETALIVPVIQGVRPHRPAGNIIPDPVWDIMQECWSHNVVDRPNISEIVNMFGIHAPVPVLITPNGEPTVTASNQMNASTSTLPAERYQGWVAAAISPFGGFIDVSVNPRDHYLDLQEIAEKPGGLLYVARLANIPGDHLKLPTHVKEREQQDRLALRTTFVAIKCVPILPSGSTKLSQVLRELRIMRDLQCENILGMDALYVDTTEDTLWIRMEFMTRSLSSVIELREVGLVLFDRTIAGCTKDIINALEYLRLNDIAPRDIRSDSVLINNQGVLKLTNLWNSVKLSASIPPSNIARNASSLGSLVWEMATGQRPPLHLQPAHTEEEDLDEQPLSPTFDQFIQMCFNLEDWSPLSSIASRSFIKLCFEPSATTLGYQRLIEVHCRPNSDNYVCLIRFHQSPFIRDACERPALAQLLVQCTAFEGRLRGQRRTQ